jgi:MFS family permease
MSELAGAARSWTPIIVHAVLLQVFTYSFRPALSYAVLDAGGQTAVLGLLGTAFALPALLLALPSGRLVDRIGERRAGLFGGGLLAAAGATALLGQGSVEALMIAMLLMGAGHLLSVVAEQALVANRSRAGARERAFGLYTLSASVGQALGPLLIAIPSPGSTGPWLEVVLALATGLALLVIASSIWMRSSMRAASEPDTMLASSGRLLRSPGVPQALIASSIAIASIDVTLAFWPALGEERGLPAAIISAMLVTRALATIASRAALPRVAERLTRPVILIATLSVSALSLAATALPVGVSALLAFAAIYGLTIGVCQPVTMSWLTDESPIDQRGLAMSLRLAGNRIGQSTIPLAVGAVAPAAGAAGVVLATAATLTAATLVSGSARRRSR